LHFTNSAALRAAPPCKISSCLPIHPFDLAQGKAGRTLPVHPTACTPNPVRVWKCFWCFDEHIRRMKKVDLFFVDLLMLARSNVRGAEGSWLSINLEFENF
jgi:hypothetical protein